ncbi:MAG: Ig-like domain-containing protein [Ignavibacteria bacterium]|jgi:uncharacterized protein (DUF2141 family)|nr:Ig-like domain-containing protein [Ignavibacteria bacterium]
MKHLRILIQITFAIFLVGCANMSAPSGGEGIKQTPTIIRSSVQDGQLNFSEKNIILEFSAYMNRASVTDNIQISPTTNYTYKWSAKKITLFLSDSLTTATTYSLQLTGDYSDYYGNKSGAPFYIVFSTGENIDTGKIVGSIVTEKSDGYYIFCYTLMDEQIDYSHRKPDYKVQVANDKTFTIPALKDGTYRIITVKDADKDGLINQINDTLGIPTFDPTIVSQNTANIKLIPHNVMSPAQNEQDTTQMDTNNLPPQPPSHKEGGEIDLDDKITPVTKVYSRLSGSVNLTTQPNSNKEGGNNLTTQPNSNKEGDEIDLTTCNVESYLIITSKTNKYQTKITADNTFIFPEIEAGEYSIMYFCDLNGNGEYDYGSLEPVFSYAEPFTILDEKITIKEHWSVDDFEVRVK